MSSGKVIHGSSLSRDKRVATGRLLNSTAIRLVSFYESKNPSFSSTSSSSEEKNDKVDDANIVASGGNGGILLVTRPVLYYKTENALIGKYGVRGLNS